MGKKKAARWLAMADSTETWDHEAVLGALLLLVAVLPVVLVWALSDWGPPWGLQDEATRPCPNATGLAATARPMR